MNNLSTWENVFLIATMLAVAVFFFPSAMRALERSKDAPKDWAGLLLPLAAVVALVLILIMIL